MPHKHNFHILEFIDNFDDAMSDMPDQFIIGTMRGSFIHKLAELSENVFKQMLNLQLRVPLIHEDNNIEPTNEADDSEDKIGLIDFSRPSDYRMKAIEAKSAGINLGDETSQMLGGEGGKFSTVGTTSTDSFKTGTTPYEGKCKSSIP